MEEVGLPMDFENPDFKHLFFDAIFNNEIVGNIISLYKGYVRSLGLTGTETVLEFGSGTGGASRHLAKALRRGGGHLICVDTSNALTRIARKRLRTYPNIEFKIGDIRRLDVEDSSCDGIFIHFALHDVDEDQRRDVVDALVRKLKPDGKVFIREPIKQGHGMPVEAIRTLMSDADLEEQTFKLGKSLIVGPMYTAVFARPSQVAAP
jgi:ubiquinone/menaquinone biosynthesis C-methylase UbiE